MARGHHREGGPVPPPEPLAVPVVDAHCHLDLLDGGAAAVAAHLAESTAVGVPTLVSIGVDVATSRWQAAVAGQFDEVWAAVAVHPNEAADGHAAPADIAEIATLAALPQVRAIGETGLDHYRTTSPEGHAAQEVSFREHIRIAKENGKALVIHDRDAHADVLRVLATDGAPDTVVFHAFSGDAELAALCADNGWYCSFAGNVTFTNAPQLRAAAAVVPAELLLVETDAPFLTPVPFRGRPNGPHLIPLTMRLLAETRGADLDELCGAVAANARRVFALP